MAVYQQKGGEFMRQRVRISLNSAVREWNVREGTTRESVVRREEELAAKRMEVRCGDGGRKGMAG